MAEDETNHAPVANKEEDRKPKQEPSSLMKGLAIILVIVAFAVVGYSIYKNFFYLPFDPEAVHHDGGQLYIVKIGEVAPDAIEIVKANIQREFPEFGKIKFAAMPLPEEAKVDLGPGTPPPYSADALLAAMEEMSDDMPDLFKAMGIIEEPLYMEDEGPEKDIWGLTNEIGGNFGVVSTTLKRREIEREGHKPGSEDYACHFDLSLGKSTLHEFGHLMGLRHCNGNIGCPMEISSPMSALLERGNIYCKKHRGQLTKLYRTWDVETAR